MKLIMTNPGTREFMQERLSSLTKEGYSFGMLFFLRRVAWHLDNTKCFPDHVVANDDSVDFVYKGVLRDLHCLFYNDKTVAIYYRTSEGEQSEPSYGTGRAKHVAKSITRFVECL